MPTYIKTITESDFFKIDTPQMIEVDRLMMEDYHIELIQMMENAGRCLAILSRDIFLNNDPQDKKIAVLAGTGGNGGGALVCARRLHNWGAKVEVYLTDDEKMTTVAKHQKNIINRMGVPIFHGSQLPHSDEKIYNLIVDGIIGYSIKGAPYGTPGEMIHWANSRLEKVISLDTPSGLDLTSGVINNPTIKADATLTLAMPKQGLFFENNREVIGELYLGDISVPPDLYLKPSIGHEYQNPFRFSDILRIY